MTILQENSGTFTGTTFDVTLPGASSASNLVVVFVMANTVINTPSGFTLRDSQVSNMGHYLFDRAGGAASYTFTNSAGQGTWYVAEVPSGAFVNSASANDTSGNSIYNTPALTPTAGVRTILASIGCSTAYAEVRNTNGWTNSFVERADVCYVGADYPMQGVAALDVTANGSTAYSTDVQFEPIANNSVSRTAIIAAYSYITAGTDSGPNAAGSAADLGGGQGSWTNTSNATGATNASYATWTAP
jgi:hypothetical protein